MQTPQLELWSAEPHTTPAVYQQLNPPQRKALLELLADLILRAAQASPSATATQSQPSHER